MAGSEEGMKAGLHDWAEMMIKVTADDKEVRGWVMGSDLGRNVFHAG